MSGRRFHLAETNIARLRHPIDHPGSAEFLNALDPVHAIADVTPGFVWRHDGGIDDDETMQAFGDPLMTVTVSVWEDQAALAHFAYKSGHVAYLRRRGEWFEPRDRAHVACWWVEPGHRPTVAEAKRHLDHLEVHGASPYAFPPSDEQPPLEIRRVGVDDPEVVCLLAELDADLLERYVEPGCSFALTSDDIAPGHGALLLAVLDGVAVGCGAVRLLADRREAAEIKRMYVRPEARGRRIGSALLAELEALAVELGARECVLEAGDRQPEALRLYERAGYRPCACWGELAVLPHGRCRAKAL